MTDIITAIEPQKRHEDRVNIYINGQFGFGLSVNLAEGITVGQSLSATEIEKLQRGDKVSQAKEVVNKYLSYRPRSVEEVRQHLSKKEYSEAVIDKLIEDLSQAKLLDDRSFVSYWIEQRESFRPRGRFALRQELYQKGINSEIIDEALVQVDEYDSALRAGKQKAIQLADTEEIEFRQKLGQYLQRRGFEYETIAEVTKALREAVIVD